MFGRSVVASALTLWCISEAVLHAQPFPGVSQSPSNPTSTLDPITPVEATYPILNFDDGVLRNEAWLLSQPVGTLATYITSKDDPGPTDTITLAAGQGRGGTDCARVQIGGTMGFWFIRHVNGGGFTANPGGIGRYIMPRGQRVNRMSMWLKFPPGYRSNFTYPVETHEWGTYHVDPVDPGSAESDGWHFYYQLHIDFAGATAENDGWVKVTVNETPQHIRGNSQGEPAHSPTGARGGFLDLSTRFYFEDLPYPAGGGTTDLPDPVYVLVDSFEMSYVPEYTDVEIQIENFKSGQLIEVLHDGNPKTYQVTVKNVSASSVTGLLGMRCDKPVNGTLTDNATANPARNTTITLTPGQTKTYTMQIIPSLAIPADVFKLQDVFFMPQSDVVPNQTSMTDNNVRIHEDFGELGSIDGRTASSQLMVQLKASSPSASHKPWIKGGDTWAAVLNTPRQGQLKAHSPHNNPLTYSITNNSTGGTITVNPSTGIFTYTPTTGFTGTFEFNWKVNDGVKDSSIGTHWINVQ